MLAEAAAAAVLMRSRVLREEVATCETEHANRSMSKRAFRVIARRKANALDVWWRSKGF